MGAIPANWGTFRWHHGVMSNADPANSRWQRSQLPAAHNLASVSGLRQTLLSDFPSTFGGLYNNGDNTFTVLTVGDGTEVEAFVNQRLGVMTSSQTLAPTVRFASTAVPLQILTNVAQEVGDAMSSLQAQGFPVHGVGIDDRSNSVVVLTSTSAPRLESYLVSHFAFHSFRIVVQAMPQATPGVAKQSPGSASAGL
jgi:hypothetical protein